jgi:hypothetical protein
VTADTNRGDSSYTQPLGKKPNHKSNTLKRNLYKKGVFESTGTQKREREKDQNLKRIKPVWKKIYKKLIMKFKRFSFDHKYN